MRAIDTNVIVRSVVRDDDAQADLAQAVIAGSGILILPTVLIESVWVLRSAYGLSRRHVAEALNSICAQKDATVVSAAAVRATLEAYANGGDFADLLHAALAAEAGATSMLTFDRRFSVPNGIDIAVETL